MDMLVAITLTLTLSLEGRGDFRGLIYSVNL